MRYSISRIKRMFLGFLGSVSPSDVAKSPDVDFSRNRKCNLFDTLFSIIMMGCHSLNTEKDSFFFAGRKSPPTKSAFVQQRGKLSDNAFPFLFNSLNTLFPFEKKYKGLHLLACDGTSLNVPSLAIDIDSFMPYAKGNGGFYQYHLNALYDILEDRYVDARIRPIRLADESAGLAELVDRNILKEPCLYIADRGYISFNNLAHIQKASQYYLIRARDPATSSSCLQHIIFPNDDEFDMSHTFIISRSKCSRNSDMGIYKCVKKKRFDFIPEEDKVSTYSISLRIVRLRLSSGNYEYLVTNLPENRFSLSELKELYHLRWGIETSFRHLKYSHALIYFHSRKRSFIRQEIYAHMICYNLISLIKGSVRIKKGNTKYKYVLSVSDTVAIGRRLLLGQISISAAKELLLRYRQPIRPGRSSPRNVVSQRVKALNNRS